MLVATHAVAAEVGAQVLAANGGAVAAAVAAMLASANAVAFLASDVAGYITGATLLVNGGALTK